VLRFDTVTAALYLLYIFSQERIDQSGGMRMSEGRFSVVHCIMLGQCLIFCNYII
jgi:hypothetical protein